MDGTNMPQTNATYTPTDAQQWSGTIRPAFDGNNGLWAAYAALKAWRPNSPEVAAMGQALEIACTAVRSLEAEAFGRLGLNPPLDSGGRPKSA